MFFDEVREELLGEAQKSPSLLADLAGLEQYVAESYHARSFTELLQNADDAGAVRFKVRQTGDHILVANDGRVFTRDDFEGLCRSAHSSKVRGSSIGFRGIGFKSVVGFTQRIHLFSDKLAVTFSQERTAQQVPQAERVPLIRVPHVPTSAELAPFREELETIQSEGYSTVFVFGDLYAREIEAEFESFDFTSLLFLRRIRQVEFQGYIEELATARRQATGQRVHTVQLATSRGVSSWTVFRDGDIAVAFGHDDSGIHRLEEKDAVVHAFLPTEEPTGLGVKVNGDVSTDPSRRQVILDEYTAMAIERMACLIVELIDGCLKGSGELGDPAGALGALVPSTDPRMLVLRRRSFSKELLNAIQRKAGRSFGDLRSRPNWLNPNDFQRLADESGLWALGRELDAVQGLAPLLRFLGASEATFGDLTSALVTTAPSVSGCAEVVAHLISRYSTKQIDHSYISPEWIIWPIGDSIFSLRSAQELGKPLNRAFVDMIAEKTTSLSDLRQFLQRLPGVTNAQVLVPGAEEDEAEDSREISASEKGTKTVDYERTYLSLSKWRSAEQQVLALLTAQGFGLSDVSRQNVGYDLEGITPEGSAVFIEVKSIDYPGQPFTLTNNEIAVAGEKLEEYWLALVRQGDQSLEVALIQDPANRLEVTRKCRQWVWECSSYDFRPESYPLQDR